MPLTGYSEDWVLKLTCPAEKLDSVYDVTGLPRLCIPG